MLVVTDYFTKWVEAVPMRSVASKDVISFVKKHIIHRFGIPQTITTDGGSVFISDFVSRIHQDITIPSGLQSRCCVAMGDHGRIEAC